jgi:membrane protease YdiL (CAAX protease family)
VLKVPFAAYFKHSPMIRDFVLNRPVKSFFILTFLISWVLWSPFYFMEGINEFWALPGAWGPTIAALVITTINEGRAGMNNLMGRLLQWRVPLHYYGFAIVFCSVLNVISMYLNFLFFEGNVDFSSVPEGMGLDKEDLGMSLLLLPIFFVINTFVGGPIAEELGWRGFAQEKLQADMGHARAGIWVGLFWFLWHLPLILFLPQATGGLPIHAYAVIMILMGGLFGWLYAKTNGSVILAILFHGGMNFENGILGPVLQERSSTRGIYILLLALVLLLLTLGNKKAWASST